MNDFHFRGGVEVSCFLPSAHYPLYDFDLRATHARTLLHAALASVSFGFVLVRVRVRVQLGEQRITVVKRVGRRVAVYRGVDANVDQDVFF